MAGTGSGSAEESTPAPTMESLLDAPATVARRHVDSNGNLSLGILGGEINVWLTVQVDRRACIVTFNEMPGSKRRQVRDESCDTKADGLSRPALRNIYARALEDMGRDPLEQPEPSHAHLASMAFLDALSDGRLYTPNSDSPPRIAERLGRSEGLEETARAVSGSGSAFSTKLAISRGEAAQVISVASLNGNCLFHQSYKGPSDSLANRWRAVVDTMLEGDAPSSAVYIDLGCDGDIEFLQLDDTPLQAGRDLSPAAWQSFSRNYAASLLQDYIGQFDLAVRIVHHLKP